MRSVLPRLGRVLAAGSAVLILAACDSTSTPMAPTEATASAKSATAAAAANPVSATVRGSVMDSTNRLLANVNIECLGDVNCALPDYQVSADGHQHRVGKTDANGAFEIVATGLPGSSSSGFMMNANGQGYEVQWQQVTWPGPACSSDQPRCIVAVNFRLNPMSEPAE